MARELVKNCSDAKYLIELTEKQSESIASFLNGLIVGSEEKESFESVRSEDLKNIRKRKSDGLWEYRYYAPSGRISVYAKTLKQLLLKRKQIVLAKKRDAILLECNSFKVKSSKPGLFDYANYWFKNFKKQFVGKSSQDMYVLAMKSIEHLNQPIDEVKVDELQKVIISTMDRPRVKDYLVLMVRQVFKKALQEDLITKDISQFLEKGKTIENKGRSLTLEEQKLVLRNLGNCKIGKLILFYLLTGCRRAEALLIQKKDINFEKNVIEVKGTKTQSSKRYVLISEKLKRLLQDNFDEMFSISHNNIGKLFKKFVDELGISGITIHSLRHTFSTNLYYLGVPDKQRQALLGHASIVMTNDIYTHLDPTITREDIVELYGDWYPF